MNLQLTHSHLLIPNDHVNIYLFLKAIIPDLHVDAHAGAMHTVGHFLKELQGRVQCLLSKTVQASKTPHEGTFMLHYGPKYGIMKLTQMIVGIYCGLPHPFEVFHCYHDTTEEELNLFMKRTAKHPLQYLILQVNKLPFKLQEVCSIITLHTTFTDPLCYATCGSVIYVLVVQYSIYCCTVWKHTSRM